MLALSGVAAAEFVAREKDFRCLLDGRAVAGKHFFVKRGGRFNPEGDGWEFFRLAVTPAGTRILARGGAEVVNIAGSCQSCHAAARSYDFVCEGHAVASLGLSEETIRALQHDPRRASAP